MSLYDENGNRATKVRGHIRRLNGYHSNRGLVRFIAYLLSLSFVVWLFSEIWVFALALIGIMIFFLILFRWNRLKRKICEFKMAFHNWRN